MTEKLIKKDSTNHLENFDIIGKKFLNELEIWCLSIQFVRGGKKLLFCSSNFYSFDFILLFLIKRFIFIKCNFSDYVNSSLLPHFISYNKKNLSLKKYNFSDFVNNSLLLNFIYSDQKKLSLKNVILVII